VAKIGLFVCMGPLKYLLGIDSTGTNVFVGRFGDSMRSKEPYDFYYAFMYILAGSIARVRQLHARAPNGLIERAMVELRANLKAVGQWTVLVEGPTTTMAPFKVTPGDADPLNSYRAFDVFVNEKVISG